MPRGAGTGTWDGALPASRRDDPPCEARGRPARVRAGARAARASLRTHPGLAAIDAICPVARVPTLARHGRPGGHRHPRCEPSSRRTSSSPRLLAERAATLGDHRERV